MAVRAEQCTLAGLQTQLFEAVCAAAGKAELLALWIEVVELERCQAAIVAADLTGPAGLFDKRLLYLLASADHGFCAASRAPVAALCVPHVHCRPMARAHQRDL